jgi:hypothetical protein
MARLWLTSFALSDLDRPLHIEGVSWLLRSFFITAPAQFKKLEDAFLKLLAKISQLSAD